MAINTRTSSAIGGAAQGAQIGMAFGPWGAAIGGIAGGLLGGLSVGGESEADKWAKRRIHHMEVASQEKLRRMRLEADNTLGYTRAAIGASNLTFQGTPGHYLTAMESELRREMAWERQQDLIEQRMVEAEADMAIDQMQASGMQSMLGSLGSLTSLLPTSSPSKPISAPIPSTTVRTGNGVSHTSASRYRL